MLLPVLDAAVYGHVLLGLALDAAGARVSCSGRRVMSNLAG